MRPIVIRNMGVFPIERFYWRLMDIFSGFLADFVLSFSSVLLFSDFVASFLPNTPLRRNFHFVASADGSPPQETESGF